MSINQKAIAEKLNVSISTVSRSLSNKPGIGEQTRKRVLEAATRLGYRHGRSRAARSNVNGRTRQLGVLIATCHETPSAVQFRHLAGVSEQARQSNVALHVSYVPPESREQLHCCEHLPVAARDGLLDGYILLGSYKPESVRELAIRFPCTWLAHHDLLVLDCMTQDHFSGMRQLIDCFRNHGHEQIGLIADSDRRAYNHQRLAGYLTTIPDADPRNILNVFGTPLALPKVFEQACERIKHGVKAWACTNDTVGYRFIRHLYSQDICVPDDIAVGGFDNLAPPTNDLAKLTSIDAPFEEIGATAVRQLLFRIENPSIDPVHMLLPCRLIPGETII